MHEELSSFTNKIKSSVTAKLIFIGGLILLLQIPILMIQGLIRERETRKHEAIEDIASKWGGRQEMTGPFISIPVTEKRKEHDGKKEVERVISHNITVLPDSLAVKGELDPQVRYRGIYQAVLYRGEFGVKGSFSFPEGFWRSFQRPGYEIHFQEAALFFGVSDIKGLSKTDIKLNGESMRPVSGVSRNHLVGSGFRIPLKHAAEPLTGELFFELQVGLNGSSGISFYPLGIQTQVDIGSSWDSPSFQGAFLPHVRQISGDGFTAGWQITDMNRNYPQSWLDNESKIDGSAFGADFYVPANVYQQTERAVNYSILFIIFIMMVFLFAEALAKVWMHPVQYFLVGLGIVLFYALLLSLGEHLSFCMSYAVAALAVSLLVGGYCAIIFRKGTVALVEGAAMLAAYGMIYLLLQMKDYALIAGCVTLFILLAVLMLFTGNLNKKKTTAVS